MATEVKQVTEQVPTEKSSEEKVVANARLFWGQNSKSILYGVLIIVLVVGGFLGYKLLYIAPQEQKAAEVIWKAEDLFKKDSFNLALNGDGINPGFLKIISKYGSTRNGNRAKFYAGACYLQLGDFNNAIKYLKDFSADEVLVAVRANGLLGDAYSELGKKDEAISYYKKAGTAFPEDEVNSPEYLVRAALLLQDQGKTQDAINLLREVKSKYPGSTGPQGQDVDKYLGKLGDTKQ